MIKIVLLAGMGAEQRTFLPLTAASRSEDKESNGSGWRNQDLSLPETL